LLSGSSTKWIANRDPITDKANINALIFHLENVGCNKFILISTVDVFMNPVGIDEESVVDEVSLHPYGQHRRDLEKFVENHFPNHLIVRLPGLVGPGLRKNVIFDFLNNNNLHTIDSRGIFQFYPMVNLWSDINTALQSELKLVHLTAEPISVSDIAEFGFGKHFVNKLANPPASYDFCTKHAALFGGKGLYQYSKRETVLAIRAYAQSEPLTIKSDLGTGAL
jgi:hypothetical protein